MIALVEERDTAAVQSWLDGGSAIDLRTTASIQLGATIHRFVADHHPLTVGSFNFLAAPALRPDNIADGGPNLASTLRAVLAPLAAQTDSTVLDGILNDLTSSNLPDAPVSVGEAFINPTTGASIGLRCIFSGFITGMGTDHDAQPPHIWIECADHRAFAHNIPPRYYSDAEHRRRHGEASRRWISDIIFRSGKSTWNGKPGSGSGAVSTPSFTGGGQVFSGLAGINIP